MNTTLIDLTRSTADTTLFLAGATRREVLCPSPSLTRGFGAGGTAKRSARLSVVSGDLRPILVPGVISYGVISIGYLLLWLPS